MNRFVTFFRRTGTGAAIRSVFGRCLLAGTAAAALSGCSIFGSSRPPAICPAVSIAGDLASVSRFNGSGTGFPDLATLGEIRNVKDGCTFDAKGVTIDMTVTLLAQLGPAATSRSADFQYFVAITDPQERILVKEVFPSHLDFQGNQQRAGAVETLQERIPLPDQKVSGEYRVIVGFQLAKDELEYNRRRRGS